MYKKPPAVIALVLLLVSVVIMLPGCTELEGNKVDDNLDDDKLLEQSFCTFPEAGLSPTVVEYALIGEKVEFLAMAPGPSPNGESRFDWAAYYDDETQKGIKHPEYSTDKWLIVSTKTKEERAKEGYRQGGGINYSFLRAHEWTVTLKIIGAPDTDQEVILGEYSAKVKVRSMRINPSEITRGVKGKDYTFTAETVGPALPDGNYTYKWEINQEMEDFWDTSFETKINQMTYAFKEGGNYDVTVSVSAGGRELVGQSKVTIADLGLTVKTPESPLNANMDYTFVAERLLICKIELILKYRHKSVSSNGI